MPIDKQNLALAAFELGFSLSEEQLGLLSSYYDFVIENNKIFNLTAIIEESDFVIKHYIDSFYGAKYIPQNSKVCDIGAGAGFPSVPLAILRSDIEVLAVDSTAKKMNFVADCAKQLKISNIKTLAGRIEEQKQLFSYFDIVTARAVSSLNILLELCLPLLKTGGSFIAYKTDLNELDTVKNALNMLGGVLSESKEFTLPNGDKRAILIFKKVRKTPDGFPRLFGAIKNKPL